MKSAFVAATMIAGVAVAGAASATVGGVNFDFTPGASSPGSAGYTVVQNFNSSSPSGLTGSNYIIHAATPNDSQGAAPNNSNSTYLAVLAGGTATYTLANAASSIQFDWGTASSDNSLTVLTTLGEYSFTVPNSAAAFLFLPAGPNYGKNGLLTATATGGLITGLRFSASTNSFELDNIAVSGAIGAVPEPASWAMMVLGFGLIGAAARSRKTAVTFA